jgi:hypothetical protein
MRRQLYRRHHRSPCRRYNHPEAAAVEVEEEEAEAAVEGVAVEMIQPHVRDV